MWNWTPDLDWTTPAGKLVDDLLARLPENRVKIVTVFGSAALQISVCKPLLSGDVDIFASDSSEEVAAILENVKFSAAHQDPYLHLCTELSFRATPNWQDRAFVTLRKRHKIRFPHPHDILIGKMHRLDAKDVRAFELVIEKTGHPTEEELKEDLQKAVDLYRPSFDDEHPSAILPNTQTVWEKFFGHSIDVRKEIITPAIESRRQDYALKEKAGNGKLRAIRRTRRRIP